MRKLEILKGKQSRNDYPYGRLKCKITFEVEFVKGKGFRFVTQTKNPKTGRLNNPKKSTYSQFMVQYRDDNGHNKCYSIGLTGYDDVEHLIEFLKLNDVDLTKEQSQDVWCTVIACIRNNALYMRLKKGVSVSQLLDATRVATMIKFYGAYEPINKITEIDFSVSRINNLKDVIKL